MKELGLGDASFLLLHRAMRPDYQEAVLKRALSHAKSNSSPVCRLLMKAIRKLQVDGYKNANRAPIVMLLPQALQAVKLHPEQWKAVLPVWLESQPELQDTAREFLVGKGIGLDNTSLIDGFTSTWAIAEVEQLAVEFLAQHQNFDRDDVMLMFCCLTARAPLTEDIEALLAEHLPQDTIESDSEEIEPEEGIPPAWRAWLDELEGLEATAREWEQVPALIRAIQSITEEKRQEREAGRDTLRSTIDALISEAGDEIEFFEFGDVSSWSAETCPVEKARELAERIAEMQACLVEHRELRQRSVATLAEQKRLQSECGKLESRIVDLHDRLSTELTEAGAPDPTETPPSRSTVPGGTEEEADQGLERAPASTAAPHPVPPDVQTIVTPEEGDSSVVSDATSEQSKPAEQAAPPIDTAEAQTVEEEGEGTIAEVTPPRIRRLIPVAQAAAAARSQGTPEDWLLYLAALVAEDDLAGAYWVARSLAAASKDLPVPDWLLEAIAGARWLTSELDAFSMGLLEIAKNHAPADDGVQIMLGLAAALRPALIAPASGMAGWLGIPDCCPAVRNLVAVVDEFAKLGVALHPEHLQGATGTELRQKAIVAVAAEATRWLNEANARRPKFKRAADVWRRLVAPNGGIGSMLAPVSRSDRASIGQVEQRLHQWRERDYVLSEIDAIDVERAGKKKRRIDGDAREYIVRGVEDACAIAANWCDLVKRERDLDVRGNWLLGRVAKLRDDVEDCLPGVEDALASVIKAPGDALLRAAVRCLQRSIFDLRALLSLTPTTGHLEPTAHDRWSWLATNVTSLQAALNRRLLLVPEVSLSNDMVPTRDGILCAAKALCSASIEERTPRVAFDRWLQNQDYRFIETLLSSAGREDDTADLMRSYQEALAGSRASLRENKNRSTSEIEQSLLDGVISEEERSEHLAFVESIDEDEVIHFAPRYEGLKHVRGQLAEARQKRLAEVQARWQGLEARLASSSIPAEEQDQVRETLNAALNRGDVRVADEHLAQLEEVLDTGDRLDASLFTLTETRDPLQEFTAATRDIEEWLERSRTLQPVANAIGLGRTKLGLSLELPKPRLRETAEAIDAWRRLKHRGLRKREIIECAKILLRYLGFSFDSSNPSPLEIGQAGPEWTHLRATMSASDLARPIPQFGSLAQHRYDLVLLWERPSADVIAARLQELRLTPHPVLVFYLGRLTERQRRDVMRTSRQRDLALAVLDETLLVFLAHERDARLPAFLRCALPYGALNPYTPFQAGDVPPEMFYGREAMAHELQLATGSCLVYGGRQLGKSALLRHVQRLFHHPEREQYAWIENMKLVFEPRGGKRSDNIWRTLRDGFRQQRLLPARARADRPEQIRHLLRDAMRGSPERRVLVMFDEADDLLDADAAADFPVVTALRELMLETQRRFKIVFAGLHNVQRFQGIPNQPLAHFGTPICVGPLEPPAAAKLVREPLEALGYRFAGDDGNATVLRILSYTNYHPGLIQLFCHELLQALHQRTRGELPPYLIRQSDVEAVYRQPDVRQRIRERLEWTLALDMHYEAVALTMIVDQMGAHDSYATPYAAGTILEEVRDWWSDGFADVSIEHFRGGVLEEMVGLGVLVRNIDGHYRLRSPNLVRLIGTEDDVADRLLELSKREPPRASDSDSHHALLDKEGHHYSPLTYAQERSLSPARSGVSLVFASEAQGAPVLMRSFRRFAPEGPDGNPTWYDPPPWIIDAEALRRWLDSRLEESNRSRRVVFCYQPTSRRPQELERLVRTALEFCARLARGPQVRILFLFDPPATWAWLSLPESTRRELEDRSDAALFPEQWNHIGVKQRLELEDKLGTDEVCRRIMEVTGGWSILLDTLFERCEKHSDPRTYVDQLEEELALPDSELAQRFRRALGIDGNEVAHCVLQFVAREGTVTEDLVVPAFVADERSLSNEECKQGLEFLVRMGCLMSVFEPREHQEGLETRPKFTVNPVVRRVLGQS